MAYEKPPETDFQRYIRLTKDGNEITFYWQNAKLILIWCLLLSCSWIFLSLLFRRTQHLPFWRASFFIWDSLPWWLLMSYAIWMMQLLLVIVVENDLSFCCYWISCLFILLTWEHNFVRTKTVNMHAPSFFNLVYLGGWWWCESLCVYGEIRKCVLCIIISQVPLVCPPFCFRVNVLGLYHIDICTYRPHLITVIDGRDS